MSRYESIEKSIYDDLDDLSLEGIALYLWSFINPRCNLAGLYRVRRDAMLESKVPHRKLTQTLSELKKKRYLFYDRGYVWVRSRIKHLPTKGPKIAQPIFRDVASVDPRNPLRIGLIYHYCVELPQRGDDYGWLSPLLQTLDVVPHTEDDLYPSDGSSKDESSATQDESLKSGVVVVKEPTTAERLFDYWRAQAGRTDQTRFSAKRKAAVAARLIEGYDEAMIRRAIEGVSRLPFNINGRRAAAGTEADRFDDLELICRNGENLERFASLARSTPTAQGQNVVSLGRKCRRCRTAETEHGAAFCEGCAEIVAGGGDAA